MRPSGRAWSVLAAGVIIYDLAAPHGETLSDGADRAMEAHRWLTLAVACCVTGHVCNLLRPRYDPIHRVFEAARRAQLAGAFGR